MTPACGTTSSASRRRSPSCAGRPPAPVHAYLFVGPSGSTKHEAARAFAAAAPRRRRRPRRARRPPGPRRRAPRRPRGRARRPGDLQPTRPARSSSWPSLAPVEGDRKVLVLHDFHLLTGRGRGAAAEDDRGAAAVDDVHRARRLRAARAGHDRLALRAHRLPLDPRRRARRPAASPRASTPATRRRRSSPPPAATSPGPASSPPTRRSSSAGGRSPSCPVAARRHRRGRGAAASTTCWRRSTSAAAPLAERHAAEVAELDARIERFGERGSGRKPLEERHRRELRRHRTDELRSGLGVLAGAYRDLLVAGGAAPPGGARRRRRPASTARIEALEHNPNEPLLLQSLLWSLPRQP